MQAFGSLPSHTESHIATFCRMPQAPLRATHINALSEKQWKSLRVHAPHEQSLVAFWIRTGQCLSQVASEMFCARRLSSWCTTLGQAKYHFIRCPVYRAGVWGIRVFTVSRMQSP